MPELIRNRNPLPWIAFFAVVLVAFVWRPQAQAQGGMSRPASYKYAIVQFQGNDAIVHIAGGAQFYEGPDILNEERVTGNNNLKLLPVIQLTHLDNLGREGWEVIRPWGSGGASWLLRRTRSD